MVVRKRKKVAPKKLSSEEKAFKKEQTTQRTEIRKTFRQCGFVRVPNASDKQFTFKGAQGDLDDIFVYENIILLFEYTCSTKKIGQHLKKKKILFDKINENKKEFLAFLQDTFPTFEEVRNSIHHLAQCKIKIIYASRHSVDEKDKKLVNQVVYLDYPILKYFLSVTTAVRYSARFEIFNFLDLNTNEIKNESGTAEGCVANQYKGSILPEAHSNFGDGFKVVSFYVNPFSLLQRSYVLRRDGWRDSSGLYQRMITANKVEKIRAYLKNEKRVFVNNIIVTLPHDTKILNNKKDTVDTAAINDTVPVTIQLPADFNSIGIIDGQHRVFSYHEGGKFEEEIKPLRHQQNLLVTGIVYPKKISDLDKTKFEARLFLEINSTQTNAKSDLKQEIGLLLTPFSPPSIGMKIILSLGRSGVLSGQFERYFFDKNKVKTTSIVSFGLVPIVKLSGTDSFYSIWDNPNKEELKEEKKSDILDEYISFCFNELNAFLLAVKKVLPNEKWTADKRVKGRVLTTTHINGFIICLRHIINKKTLNTTTYYEKKLSDLKSFDFSQYHSSQYGRMGRDIFNNYFADTNEEKIIIPEKE